MFNFLNILKNMDSVKTHHSQTDENQRFKSNESSQWMTTHYIQDNLSLNHHRFLLETIQARRLWTNIFRVMKEINKEKKHIYSEFHV